jgi:hypothetical protein
MIRTVPLPHWDFNSNVGFPNHFVPLTLCATPTPIAGHSWKHWGRLHRRKRACESTAPQPILDHAPTAGSPFCAC